MIIKNKKGLTLVELLVCVVLVSSLSLMMYKLLSNVNTKRKAANNLGNIIVKGGEATIKLEDLIKDEDINVISYSNNKISFYKRNINSSPIATIEFSTNTDNKSTISIIDLNDPSNKGTWSFENTTITACATSDSKSIDIYLVLKNANTKKVTTTIEFPYYNESGISVPNFSGCDSV